MAGILFILISNYFGVLAPQVTSFIIDFVQQSLGHKVHHAVPANAGYDVLVMRFIRYVE
jgi:ATP-binding cassette subfamily B multidrug efflux pump